MEILALILPELINSIGLMLDIVGAFLVATEVVKQYHGEKYGNIAVNISCGETSGSSPLETESFEKWEKEKYFRMKLGLFFLVIGFILQISSNIIRIFNCL